MKQTCPNCGHEIEQDAMQCNYCGSTVAQNLSVQLTCPTCGKLYPSGVRFCDVDGSSLYGPNAVPTASPVKSASNSNYSVTLLLIFAIIFSLCELVGLILPKYTNDFEVAYVFWTIETIALLLIPLSIKKLPLKIIGFVLLAPIVVLYTYYNIKYICGAF